MTNLNQGKDTQRDYSHLQKTLARYLEDVMTVNTVWGASECLHPNGKLKTAMYRLRGNHTALEELGIRLR